MKKELTSDEMMTAILSYLGILVLIPYFVVKKKNSFIKFHIKQGLALLTVYVVVWIAQIVLAMIPYIGTIFSVLIGLIYLGLFVVAIIAIIKAVQGEEWKIPVVSSFMNLFDNLVK